MPRYIPKGIDDIHSKTCTQKFVVALCIIVKKWKPPKCPSAGYG